MNKLKTAVSVMLGVCVLMVSMLSVSAANSAFSVKADEIEYDLKTGSGTAKGNVVLYQEDGVAKAAAAEFNSKNKTGRLTGGVVADKDNAHIVANTLVMHSENFLSAIGDASLTKDDKTLSAGQVDYHKNNEVAETIGNWARLTMTDGSVLNAGTIKYNGQTGVANAGGGVTISSPPRNLTAAADNAVYQTANNGYIELVGNATATQDGNTVAGNKLRINNTGERAEAFGDIKIVYIPKPGETIPNGDTTNAEKAVSAKEASVEVVA